MAIATCAAGVSARRPSTVALRLDAGTVARVTIRDASGRPWSEAAIARRLPARLTTRRARVSTTYAVDRRATARLLVRAGGDDVAPRVRRLATSVAVPVTAQRLRNNCETAALSALLAATGLNVDQLQLQRELPRSSSLDPTGPQSDPVWGDPDLGYVGREDGSGVAGGFGVYPQPLRALAARHGRTLRDLTGTPPSTVYAAVASGHAVMAWVGLGDGPYRSWQTPDGRPITVNLNEHTIVVTGVRNDESLEVMNVLQGTREAWSREQFERAWQLLGRRALATT